MSSWLELDPFNDKNCNQCARCCSLVISRRSKNGMRQMTKRAKKKKKYYCVICSQTTDDDDDVSWIANWQHTYCYRIVFFVRAVVPCVCFFFRLPNHMIHKNETLNIPSNQTTIHIIFTSQIATLVHWRERKRKHTYARVQNIFSCLNHVMFRFHFQCHDYVVSFEFRFRFSVRPPCLFYFPFIQAIELQVNLIMCLCVCVCVRFDVIVMKLYKLQITKL